jgi:hypothetical protein
MLLRRFHPSPEAVIPTGGICYLRGSQTEEEEALPAGLSGHFDRGAVSRTNRQRTIHHELHVTGAT